MTVKKVLDSVLRKTGWSRYRLAKEIGISTQAMDHMLKSDSKGVRLKVLIKLQEVSGISVETFWKLLRNEHQDIDNE